VNHIDGNKANNFYKNLEWVTSKENMAHAIENGLMNYAKGEDRSNLKKEEIILIRDLYKTGRYTHKQLGDKFNLSRRYIGNIINRKRWKHI